MVPKSTPGCGVLSQLFFHVVLYWLNYAFSKGLTGHNDKKVGRENIVVINVNKQKTPNQNKKKPQQQEKKCRKLHRPSELMKFNTLIISQLGFFICWL